MALASFVFSSSWICLESSLRLTMPFSRASSRYGLFCRWFLTVWATVMLNENVSNETFKFF